MCSEDERLLAEAINRLEKNGEKATVPIEALMSELGITEAEVARTAEVRIE